MLRIRFWGVRGSIASAGARTVGVGGNTSCVEIVGDDGAPLCILDAGTGLRALGEELAARGGPVDVPILLSHLHWDHIQGFPFFAPAYAPGNRLALWAPERCVGPGRDVRAALAAQMRAPHFPVSLDAMRARLDFHAVAAGAELELPGGLGVRAAAAKHPNGCLAYRVTRGGRSVVYATDTEHEGERVDGDLMELARGADVLVYDAQYTEAEHALKRGWGHSTATAGVRLAEAAGVTQLVLFHHDPTHDDAQIAAIERATQALFPSTIAAREGLELRLQPLPVEKVA